MKSQKEKAVIKLNRSFEDLRIALMNKYNSRTITYAGYIIALAVGALSVVSRWNDLWLPGNSAASIGIRILLILIILGIVSFITFFSLRTVYWVSLGSYVMIIDEKLVVPDPTHIISIENLAKKEFDRNARFPHLRWYVKQTCLLGHWYFPYTFLLCLLASIVIEHFSRAIGL